MLPGSRARVSRSISHPPNRPTVATNRTVNPGLLRLADGWGGREPAVTLGIGLSLPLCSVLYNLSARPSSSSHHGEEIATCTSELSPSRQKRGREESLRPRGLAPSRLGRRSRLVVAGVPVPSCGLPACWPAGKNHHCAAPSRAELGIAPPFVKFRGYRDRARCACMSCAGHAQGVFGEQGIEHRVRHRRSSAPHTGSTSPRRRYV